MEYQLQPNSLTNQKEICDKGDWKKLREDVDETLKGLGIKQDWISGGYGGEYAIKRYTIVPAGGEQLTDKNKRDFLSMMNKKGYGRLEIKDFSTHTIFRDND